MAFLVNFAPVLCRSKSPIERERVPLAHSVRRMDSISAVHSVGEPLLLDGIPSFLAFQPTTRSSHLCPNSLKRRSAIWRTVRSGRSHNSMSREFIAGFHGLEIGRAS